MPRSERGRLGGRARWDADAAARGLPRGPRVLRLADLTPQQRRLVMALLNLGEAENAKAAPAIVTPEAAQEVRRAAGEPSAA
jgi:hypothetical protein